MFRIFNEPLCIIEQQKKHFQKATDHRVENIVQNDWAVSWQIAFWVHAEK